MRKAAKPLVSIVRIVFVSLLLLLFATGRAASQEIPQPDFAGGDVISLPLPALRPAVAPRWWVQADYMLMWIQSDRTPGPLITTGSPTDPNPGALGNPSTSVLFDGSLLDYGLHSGLRTALGGWLSDERRLGIEVAGFVLETHTIHGEANSDRTGSPLIARPFFNTVADIEDAMVITTPTVGGEGDERFGGIDIFADSRTWGAEANVLASLGLFQRLRYSLIMGFRYLGQKDELRFSQSSTVLSVGNLGFLRNNVLPPNILSLKDFFETNNHFYGGQIGFRGEYRVGPLTLGAATTLALGSTFQKLHQEGWTMLTTPTTNTRAPGGLYVVGAQLGDFHRAQFSVVSDSTLKASLQVTQRLRTHLGYQFLYWDNVVRPGEQIDRNIDVKQVPSNLAYTAGFVGTRPELAFGTTDFWLQGLNFGVSFEF